MSTLQARLRGKQQSEVEARIAAKLATGKFQDTGRKYSAAEAVADSSNSNLRLTAVVDSNGQLTWKK